MQGPEDALEATGEPCASPTSPQSLQERRSSGSAAEAAPLEAFKALEGLLSELFEARACRAYVLNMPVPINPCVLVF